MPPQKKQQYEDVLGSVFDFIYSESQKPPNKVKPIKVTGVDGTSEMVDALTAVLENPLLFVNNTTIGSFKDALDMDFVAYKVGDRGTSTVKFSASDINNGLKDLSGLIDKKFAKLEAIRKSQRAAWAGEEMKGVLARMWAKQRGLDADTQRAMAAAGSQSPLRMDAYVSGLGGRNESLMQKYFSPQGKISYDEFKKRYPGDEGEEKAKSLYKKYNTYFNSYREATSIKDPLKKAEALKKLQFNKEVFSVLESTDLFKKADLARLSGDIEKQTDFEKAALFIDSAYEENELKRYKQEAQKELRELSSRIKDLKRDPNVDKEELKRLRAEMRKINSTLTFSNLSDTAGLLGRWEGIYNSTKQMVVDGDLLPMLFNGKFFDDKTNNLKYLQPSKAVTYSRKYKNGKGQEVVRGIEIHVGKGSSNRFLASYQEAMNSLYYYSPATWARTLVTGEGFAYVAYRAEEKLKSFMKSIDGIEVERIIDELAFGDDTYYKSIMDSLEAKQKRVIGNLIRKNKFFSGLGNTFSTLNRAKTAIQNFLDRKITGKFREKVGTFLLKFKAFGGEAGALVNSWMAGGGIHTLIRGIATALTAGLGPIGPAVAALLSFVISNFVYTISKPIIKASIQLAIFIVAGFFALIVLIFVPIKSSTLGVHSHVVPNEVVKCDSYTGLSPIIDDPDNPGGLNPQGPMEPFVAGALDSGEQCLLGSGSFSCTQGPYGSFSHSKVAAMDIGGTNYFHAPSFCGNGGTCKITYVRDVNCAAGYAGGLVKFTAEYKGQTYEFKLIHVDSPLAAGQTLTSGQRVARTMEWHETGSKCSSGKHLHLETKLNGATVNPHDVLTKSPSQGGFGCGISTCP